jgi:uncharacterized membrane protein YagU involved in acid resistance
VGELQGSRFLNRCLLIAFLGAGILAATLDIGAAAAINRKSPAVILRIIASGLRGGIALDGGTSASILGFVLQLTMGIVIAAVYGLASICIPLLARMWIAGGLAYGVSIFVVMTYVILPLSAAPSRPPAGISKIIKDVLAMLGFGLIISYAVHRASLAGCESPVRPSVKRSQAEISMNAVSHTAAKIKAYVILNSESSFIGNRGFIEQGE